MKQRFSINDQLSHYRILAQLGAGGMGEVWLAEDTRLHRKVALKILPAEFTADADRVRRFEREARAVSALNHPNILTIYEIGEQDGLHYIVTEFIEGRTLRDQLREQRHELLRALDVAVQVASALQAAHHAGIVHRDIKPENIMLRPDGYVKVLDFGLAKLTERRGDAATKRRGEDEDTLLAVSPARRVAASQATNPGVVLGTAQYMSPEQARGLAVDERSDVFSLGIVLYEMIAGQPPFTGETISDILAAILTAHPQPLTQLFASLPPELDRCVQRALCKDCQERYQTISELQGDLKRLRQRLEAAESETKTEFLPTATLSSPLSSPTRRTRIRKAIDSLAVLPLQNASDDAELEYLSEGITESIINSLSPLPKLRVVPRDVVFRYCGREVAAQQAGEDLNVRAVLTGRMRQLGDQLIIKVELIDVALQSQLWGEQFRRKVTDIFELEEELAEEISDKLRLKLTGDEKKKLVRRYTDNTEAYHLYLKGRHFTSTKRTEEWIRKGIEHFQQAIDLDPNYALAYAGLADAYAFLASSTGGWSPREAYPKAIAAAQKALSLDDTLAEAHCSLGFAHLLYNWNFAEAEREFKRALELNPNYANAHDGLGFYLKATGQHEAALRACEQAVTLDPLLPFAALSKGWAYYFARRFDEAIAQGTRVLELDPNFPFAWKFLGMCYGQQGSYDAAIDALEKAVELAPDVPDFKAHLALVYGLAGQRDAAQHLLSELEQLAEQRYLPPYYFALVTTGLGDTHQALAWLQQVIEERSGFVAYLKVEPIFDSLRNTPEFTALMNHLRETR